MSISCIRLVCQIAVSAMLAGVVFTGALFSSFNLHAEDRVDRGTLGKVRQHTPKFPLMPLGGDNKTPPQIDPGRGDGGGVTIGGGLGGGVILKPRKPIGVVENVVVDGHPNIPVATAIVQVVNQNNQWATTRTIVVPHSTKFRWSTTSNKAVSARWELFQPISMQKPGGNGPSAVLMAYGDLSIPAVGTKQEFSIDLAKHLNFPVWPNGMEFKVRIVVYDAAKKQIAPGSNQVTLSYLPLNVKVGNYERFSGHFEANDPVTDAFIRATIANQGSAPIEQGVHYEFYSKKGNAAPVKIGEGIVPAIGPNGLMKVIATRPVDDWDKTDAQSQYTYECKVYAVK